MKKLNVALSIVLMLLIAFVAYFFIGGTLRCDAATVTAAASEHADAFASIENLLASGGAPQQFAQSAAKIEDCTLTDVTLTLTNPGLFPAEWLEITVAPADGDVAVYSLTGAGTDVPARSSSRVNLKLISSASADAARTITVRYYVFGLQRTITVQA